MKKFAQLGSDDRTVIISNTAKQMNMHPSIVEKDFWVCYMLDCLFNDCEYKDAFVFKGGTSLSKSYHAIERFSEDIDLILDWRRIVNDESDPWDERSKTQQDKYNKMINSSAAEFYRTKLVGTINNDLIELLGNESWVAIDENDDMVINFRYPRAFETGYITPYVKLEIGPLAEWMPSHKSKIIPFVAERYPQVFEKPSTEILTVDVERTFWEKITILHKIANFPEGKPLPHRYARHFYDVYCLGNSDIKTSAFEKKDLLEKDIAFKQKFYYAKSAHYETATLKTVELIPRKDIMDALKTDYVAMSNMIYGEIPSFETILKYLEELEQEIHNL